VLLADGTQIWPSEDPQAMAWGLDEHPLGVGGVGPFAGILVA